MRTKIAEMMYLQVGFLSAWMLIYLPFWAFVPAMTAAWFGLNYGRRMYQQIVFSAAS